MLVMLAIFALSSRPSESLPRFGIVDALVKKSGHAVGYGLLALSYWRGFGWNRARVLPAWAFAVGYAVTDEMHQAFVPGRHASVVDVMVFDALGAAAALWLWSRRKRGGARPEA